MKFPKKRCWFWDSDFLSQLISLEYLITTTHIEDTGSGRKKKHDIKQSFFKVKRGDLWEPSFTLKKLCLISCFFFVPEPVSSMCVGLVTSLFVSRTPFLCPGAGFMLHKRVVQGYSRDA